MDPSTVIRLIAEGDLGRLNDAYPEPGTPESRHRLRWEFQERGDGRYLVAWRDEHPIGWVFVHRPGSPEASEHAKALDVAEIMDLQVAEPFRGQGHGAALLVAAEDVARNAGWMVIGLEVTVSNPHNDVARAMYERHGYRDAGLGEFESGYYYFTQSGERRWDGEPHRFLIKRLTDAGARSSRSRSSFVKETSDERHRRPILGSSPWAGANVRA